jgi:hypothetical protein
MIQIGGDYLEFKKIECGAQQCFPSNGGISITQNTETLDLTANTTAGYWIPDLTLQYEELFNLRVFTFTTVGNNSTDLSIFNLNAPNTSSKLGIIWKCSRCKSYYSTNKYNYTTTIGFII